MWPWPFTSCSERIYPRGAGSGDCSDMTPHRLGSCSRLREGGGGGPGLTTWLKFVPGLDKASATLIKEELYNRCVWVVSRAEDPTRPGQCLTRVSPRSLTDKEREGLTTVRLVAIKREDSGQCRSELSEHKARTEKHAIFVQKNAATDQLICFYMLVQE